jgi:hypothetical protein
VLDITHAEVAYRSRIRNKPFQYTLKVKRDTGSQRKRWVAEAENGRFLVLKQ